MLTVPAVGVSSPANNPSKVDFPDPEAPIIATASPAAMSNETSSRMASRDSPVSTCFDNPAARTMGALLLSAMLRAFLFLFLVVSAAANSSYAAGTILVFGDSLSAGYGLARDQGWVDLLRERIAREHADYKVVNASISGETTEGGRRRLNQALDQHRPQIVILELGANDALRGAQIETIRGNLAAMMEEC